MERNNYHNQVQREPRSVGKLIIRGIESMGAGLRTFTIMPEHPIRQPLHTVRPHDSTEAALQADWQTLSEDTNRLAQDTARIAIKNTSNE